MPRHLLSVDSLSVDDLENLFKYADHIRDKPWWLPAQNKILGTYFNEPSTRTRLSFEAAMLRLGGKTVSVENGRKNSSEKKGETLQDSLLAMSQIVDVIAVRHDMPLVHINFDQIKVPVINAGDGGNEHPTQAILDLYTIWRAYDWVGKPFDPSGEGEIRVMLTGDIAYSRTCRSLLQVLHKYKYAENIKVTLASQVPSMLLEIQSIFPEAKRINETEIPYYLPSTDILYMTRHQSERGNGIRPRSNFVLTPELTNSMPKDAMILHPFPRGNELPTSIDSNPRAQYLQQMENATTIRMAILMDCLDHEYLMSIVDSIDDSPKAVPKDIWQGTEFEQDDPQENKKTEVAPEVKICPHGGYPSNDDLNRISPIVSTHPIQTCAYCKAAECQCGKTAGCPSNDENSLFPMADNTTNLDLIYNLQFIQNEELEELDKLADADGTYIVRYKPTVHTPIYAGSETGTIYLDDIACCTFVILTNGTITLSPLQGVVRPTDRLLIVRPTVATIDRQSGEIRVRWQNLASDWVTKIVMSYEYPVSGEDHWIVPKQDFWVPCRPPEKKEDGDPKITENVLSYSKISAYPGGFGEWASGIKPVTPPDNVVLSDEEFLQELKEIPPAKIDVPSENGNGAPYPPYKVHFDPETFAQMYHEDKEVLDRAYKAHLDHSNAMKKMMVAEDVFVADLDMKLQSDYIKATEGSEIFLPTEDYSAEYTRLRAENERLKGLLDRCGVSYTDPWMPPPQLS